MRRSGIDYIRVRRNRAIFAIAVLRISIAGRKSVRFPAPRGSNVRPPPRGLRWKPLLRVSVFGFVPAKWRVVVALSYDASVCLRVYWFVPLFVL